MQTVNWAELNCLKLQFCKVQLTSALGVMLFALKLCEPKPEPFAHAHGCSHEASVTEAFGADPPPQPAKSKLLANPAQASFNEK